MFILLSSLSLDGKTIYSVAHSFKLGYYPWLLSLPSFPSNQTLSHDDSLGASQPVFSSTSSILLCPWSLPAPSLIFSAMSKETSVQHLALTILHSSARMIFLKCRLDPIIPMLKLLSIALRIIWRVGAWRWGVPLEPGEGRIWSLWRDGQVPEQRSQGDAHTWLSRCAMAHWIN